MKLSYRRAEYTLTHSPIETVETNIECGFLGHTSKLRVPKHTPTRSGQRTLKYRGVSYQA